MSDGQAERYRDTPSGLRLRIKQAPQALVNLVRHPDWLAERVKSNLHAKRDARRPFSLEPFERCFATEAAIVQRICGMEPDEYESEAREVWRALRELWGEEDRDDADWGNHPVLGGRPELVRLLAGLVHGLQPQRVLETGVAQGVTTAAILTAMERNGKGELRSIDLPVLHVRPEHFVGRLVPAQLKGRWSLQLGRSKRLLPPAAEALAPIDLFLHDSDHTSDAQRAEYETVWPHLRSGGVLVSDDITNPAFLEFAEDVGAEPALIGDPAVPNALGVLQKPADGGLAP